MIERSVPLRWRDFDAQGHVNHAVYLTLLEIGRDALFAEVFGTPEYVVARVEIDYQGEITQDFSEVTVQVAVDTVGTTSLTTRESIVLPDGSPAAKARVVSVLWNPVEHSSLAISETQRATLAGQKLH